MLGLVHGRVIDGRDLIGDVPVSYKHNHSIKCRWASIGVRSEGNVPPQTGYGPRHLGLIKLLIILLRGDHEVEVTNLFVDWASCCPLLAESGTFTHFGFLAKSSSGSRLYTWGSA